MAAAPTLVAAPILVADLPRGVWAPAEGLTPRQNRQTMFTPMVLAGGTVNRDLLPVVMVFTMVKTIPVTSQSLSLKLTTPADTLTNGRNFML